jgi:hypothetical protein
LGGEDAVSDEKPDWWRRILIDFATRTAGALSAKIIFAALGLGTVLTVVFAGWMPWLIAHWPQILWAISPTITASAMVTVILRNKKRIQVELLDYKSIVESCGIEGFWDFSTQAEKARGWNECTTKMAEDRFGEICIAGLTGEHTFAAEGSPLRETLLQHEGDIKILLIDESSPAFKERVMEMSGTADESKNKYIDCEWDYSGRLYRALRFCVELGDGQTGTRPRSIEVRAYDRPAIWKIIMFGNYVWLQHYVPGMPGSESSAYMFLRGRSDTMTRPLERIFRFRWDWSAKRVLAHRNEKGWVVKPDLHPPQRRDSRGFLPTYPRRNSDGEPEHLAGMARPDSITDPGPR